MGVATARPSGGMWHTQWRTNALGVGRFGEECGEAWESIPRQTHLTYGRNTPSAGDKLMMKEV